MVCGQVSSFPLILASPYDMWGGQKEWETNLTTPPNLWVPCNENSEELISKGQCCPTSSVLSFFGYDGQNHLIPTLTLALAIASSVLCEVDHE